MQTLLQHCLISCFKQILRRWFFFILIINQKWLFQPRYTWYWDDRGYIVKKKYRKPEIPPISWFYETGGISPSPRKDKNVPQTITVDVGKSTQDAKIDLREIVHEGPEDGDADTEAEETRRTQTESAIGIFSSRSSGFTDIFKFLEMLDSSHIHLLQSLEISQFNIPISNQFSKKISCLIVMP